MSPVSLGCEVVFPIHRHARQKRDWRAGLVLVEQREIPAELQLAIQDLTIYVDCESVRDSVPYPEAGDRKRIQPEEIERPIALIEHGSRKTMGEAEIELSLFRNSP